MTENDCVFCDLTRFRAAEVCIENAFCLYASTRDPRDPSDVLPGCGVIIPIAHRPSPFDFTAEEWAATHELLLEAKAAQDERLAPDGYALIWNCFSEPEQPPHHAHLHVIPRFDDEPFADRGGRSAIKVPENRRPDPFARGNGRARAFGPRVHGPAELLAAYDAQLRAHIPDQLAKGVSVERDGPLVRFIGLGDRGFVVYRDLAGLAGADVDELIARQVHVFAERGERFEWKLHGHDRPADLPRRLRAAGFVPEEDETIVIAPVTRIVGAPQLPEGVSLRDATARRDLERIAALEETISGEEHGWLAENLEAERDADPDALAIVVAEARGEVVCAGWVRFERGTDFATLWGGATLPAWRRRGIYRATVAYRASLAADRGFRFLQVDASSNSRPILERLGFTAVTTTTPYVWSPPES